MHAARLIPVSGITSEKEAEQRAASAVLAVFTIVRDLSTEVLAPLGASRARRAVVEAFTEPIYTSNGRKIRPDGLLRVTYGQSSWTALVEVKTGEDRLDAEQINDYWDLARIERFDHILTISNEISPTPGAHPTAGLRVRSNSPVQVTHLSWTALLTTAVRLKQHTGVADPEQAWILGELIRYLEHPASGALAFADMGPNWVVVRDAARSNSLNKRDPAVADIAGRWDQLLRYAALKLSSNIGADVLSVITKAHRDPKARTAHLVDSLDNAARLDGSLRIPNTVGDLQLIADLHGQQIVTMVDVPAPEDRGGKARITWLVNQLKDAPPGLAIEAYPRNARTCTTATLRTVLEDRLSLVGEDKRDPARFRLVARFPMGAARKSGGKNPGFIDSVLGGIDSFYGQVIQTITPWSPPAPKILRPPQAETPPPALAKALADDEGPAPPTPATPPERAIEVPWASPWRREGEP